jgi:transmembrane sensor
MTDNNLQTRAIEWHVRLRHGDDATWDAFADWLAQDPRNREAYEAIEQTDLAIEPLLPQVVFSETAHGADKPAGTPVPPSRRWWLAGGALAASIAAVVAFLLQLASSRYEVTTGPGQRQTVALDAATQVILNGSTRMTFDRKNPRFASLASGEALFRVHHDNAKPFTLEIGSNRIQDVGTAFNVVRDSSQVRIAVAEGKVIYSTQAQAVPLGAGQALLARSDSATVRVTTTPIASVGAWQNGRLVYSGEPLSQVAADLGRSLGVHIVVSPSIADRPFSGAIALDGAGSEQLERLKVALNVDLEAGPKGWTMKPIDDGGR